MLRITIISSFLLTTFPLLGDDWLSRAQKKEKDMTMTANIENFSLEEFECPCDNCGLSLANDLVLKLQVLRSRVGPLNINSGLRCPDYNAKIGGVKSSYHLTGEAVDIDTSKWAGSRKFELIEAAIQIGFTGIGIAKTFIHLDIRSDRDPAVWTY